MQVKISMNDSEKIIDLIKSEINDFWELVWNGGFEGRDLEYDKDPSLVPVYTARREIMAAMNTIGNIAAEVENYKGRILVPSFVNFNSATAMVDLFEEYRDKFLELASNTESVRRGDGELSYSRADCMDIYKSILESGYGLSSGLVWYKAKREILIEVKSEIARRAIEKYFDEDCADETDLFDTDK